jgi:DNA repair protein RAD57
MTDLTAVLPGFPIHNYAHLLPSLEKNKITTVDLLTLDCLEIAKRAQLPVLDVKRLCGAVLEALQGELGIPVENSVIGQENVQVNAPLKKSGRDVLNAWNTISTLDDDLDHALGGGLPTGYITELTGER